jgi:crotonobetainyl-CoA:carnitine CoA-transferase CaiB-like acyl-CoA transferase
MKRLAERSDVLITSFRPGALERIGFGEAWARSVKSDLIYVDISAFGNEGPMRNRPGYDPLVQAFAGLMSVTGNTGEEPVRVGVSIIDLSTGMWAAMGTLAALYEQKSTSLGTRVSTSLFESGLNWMSAHVGNYSASGQLPARMGSGSVSIVPYQVFPTSDGERVIAAGSDRLFAKLAQVLDCPEWLEDARFTSNGERVRNRLALIPLVRAETMKWPNDKLSLALEEAGVPSSPLNDVSGVLKEPQTEALKIVQHLRSDSERSVTVGLPFTLGGKRPGTRMPPPRLGEHTDEILSELELGQTSDERQL